MKKSIFHMHQSASIAFLKWGMGVLLITGLSACGGGGGNESPATSTSTLTGSVQKGAFQTGATITAQELDESANPTGNVANAEVINDLGAYNLSTTWSGWTELTVSGSYFDEYNGSVNSTPISLNSIQDIQAGNVTLNVNLFTHFVTARTKYRVQNTPEAISIAKAGAEAELQKALNLAAIDANKLDIHDGNGANSNANATLLLFSGSFMAAGGNTASLATLVEDFQTDGSFNVANLQNIAAEAEKPGMMARLSTNLANNGVTNPPDTEDIQQIPDWTNSAPIATDININAQEDTPTVISLQGSDVDNDPLSYIKLTDPQHGVVVFTEDTATYTPTLNFNGTDSFTYKVNDGVVDSETATVTINVGSSNDAPTADAKSATTNEDEAVEITLTGSDPEGDSLSFAKVTEPSYGSVSITGNVATYTPNENENSGSLTGDSGANFGNDTFTIKANDGAADSEPVTITVTVNPVNDAPVAGGFGSLQATDEDNPLTFKLPGFDSDNLLTSLTGAITTQPEHGQISVNGESVTYTPDSNYNGTDGFDFTLSDGQLVSSPSHVAIVVESVNDAPTADAGTDVQVLEGATISLDASNSSSAPDNDSISYSWSPADNLNNASSSQPVYTAPAVNADTEQTLTLTVTDTGNLSDSDTVKVTILNLPGQPQNVQAEKGDGEATITWDVVSDATGYDICMATESITNPENCTSLQDGQVFSDQESPTTIDNLMNETPYYFVVIPKNANGTGTASAEASVTPQPPSNWGEAKWDSFKWD